MKRIILSLAFFVSLGICVNAQNLQSGMYNDGKILVYIEQRNDIYRSNSNKRADRLQLENLSDQEITVHYCFKAIGLDRNGNYKTNEIKYKTEKLKPKEKKNESGYLYNVGGYYVDSFAVMNVAVSQNTPQSSSKPQQNIQTPQYEPRPPQNNPRPPEIVRVPSWAQGTWHRGNLPVKITSTQIIYWDGYADNCVKIDGDTIWFGNYHTAVERKNSPNQMILGLYNPKLEKWGFFDYHK